MSRPILKKRADSSGQASHHSQLGTSYRSQAIAEASIARDLEDADYEAAVDDGDEARQPATFGQHSMAGRYRRPSFMVAAPRGLLGTPQQPETMMADEHEIEAAIAEERRLLRDNDLIPPRHPRRRASQASMRSVTNGLTQRLPILGLSRSGKNAPQDEEGALQPATERTSLLNDENGSHSINSSNSNPGDTQEEGDGDPNLTSDDEDSPANIDRKWEQAILSGQIKTSWRRETKVLVRYSLPLIFTFLLQNSLTLTSIFTVGRIGKNELGAVSIGSMTANITGYAVFHGLATSLDTLCAQAYGSGRKKLVGLQLQRMVFFLWAITIPIAAIWFFGTQILRRILPADEPEIADKAGLYLKILILGAPGYSCFESAKRYVQAQGRFAATLYVLLIAAPLNILLHYLFVWEFGWGFIGCPIAIVIVENLMPLLLFLYVRFVGGMECWPGFSRKAFANWGPMIRLALPGLVMVMAEFLAFEILTLASARISATHLAANTIIQSLSVLAYNLPFPWSIAASTRVANLVGASLPEAAKITAKVTYVGGTAIGLFNMVLLTSLRDFLPHLFTDDADVIALAAAVLPINAAFQVFDSLAGQGNGLLRGLGKQEAGGYITLFAYYVIALPVSFATGFGLHWDLYGLWTGPFFALVLVTVMEAVYIYKISWERAAEEAASRNAAG